MHVLTRSLTSTLMFSLLSLAVLPTAAQVPERRNQFPSTQPCAVRTPYGQGCGFGGSAWDQSSRPINMPQGRSAGSFDFPDHSISEYREQRPSPARRAAPSLESQEQQRTVPHADPDAPDQSELLKNSKDHDFILRNFKTMYIETRGIDLFGPAQIKAELGKNPEFQKLNIHIVDDPRVADAVLVVRYTFAWDYPFELRHQNSTIVLLSGKGEGPFSGPLGAWDVARQFVNAAKPWRTQPEPKK